MDYPKVVKRIADILKEFDSQKPVHKSFKPGIGPFGEPQLVKEISKRLVQEGIQASTHRTPDLVVHKWAGQARNRV